MYPKQEITAKITPNSNIRKKNISIYLSSKWTMNHHYSNITNPNPTLWI